VAKKRRAELTLPEIRALHNRLTDQVAYLKARSTMCPRCSTPIVRHAIFCHHCGRRLGASSTETSALPAELVTVKLHGLYDEKRREELAMALIPILADLARTIDMSNVEHIDVAALTSLIPLLEDRERERAEPIDVVGMNDDVQKTLARAGFEKFFQRVG
jgi:anti-anti-sigma regulatory factor